MKIMFGWRRLLVTFILSSLVGIVISPAFIAVTTERVVGRELWVGFMALVGFGIFERWPAKLPPWIARWVLQVIGVGCGVFAAVLFLYLVVNPDPPFWLNEQRRNGFFMTAFTGLLVAPWVAVAALFRQRDVAATELERKVQDSRLRLLQAQVEPHFLFNTLANVRELVDSGSSQATQVLDSLIAYLRAAVPRLHDPATTLGQEVQLVRAYLELMHMRMPDRLQFEVVVDPAALDLRCPPMTLLTLVENAIRHGIDPSEEGGRIDVRVQMREGRCHAEVSDTGVGLRGADGGLGTGLSTLRERLDLAFGGKAKLELVALQPHGVRAMIDFPK